MPPTVPEIDAVVPAVTFPLTLAELATDTEPIVDDRAPEEGDAGERERAVAHHERRRSRGSTTPYTPSVESKLSILPPLVATDTPFRPISPTADTCSVPLWYVTV